MDKVADFYERWFATKRIPDYSGVESASEELAKQLLGVYESEKRDFWQSCGVQFLRGTILHLSSQAHMRGEETMTVRHLIEFLEADPVEKSWEQLIASQPGDEQIRWLAFRAGEFMVNNPPPVAAAIFATVLSRLLEETRAAYTGSARFPKREAHEISDSESP